MNDPRLSPRKRPSQSRSRATVDAILTAMVQVMLEHGVRSATTRRVAERAGVSVGTLYQYFPNREALVAELLRDQLSMLAMATHEALVTTQSDPLMTRLRAVIEALARVKASNAALHRALTLELPRVEGHAAVRGLQDQLLRLAQALLEEHADEVDSADLETTSFVLVHAIDGALTAALAEGGERLSDPRFVEHLCRVAAGVVTAAGE